KRVFESMPQIELYLTIGGYAQKYHLGKNAKKSVSETVASWREYVDMPIEGKRYLPLPHPSWRNTGWIKKNAYFERDLLPFLKCRVKELLV
ncbi:MAG: uracil-DNA glycosylase family protein, partial [Nitratireductor sp.]